MSRAGRQLIGGPQLSNRRQRLSWSDAQEQKESKKQRWDGCAYKEGTVSKVERVQQRPETGKPQAVRMSPGQGCMACTVLSVAEELTLVRGRCSAALASASWSWCCELRRVHLNWLLFAVADGCMHRCQAIIALAVRLLAICSYM